MSTLPPGVAADQPAYNILNNKTFTDSNVTSDANQTDIVTHAPHADVEWPPLVVYGVPVLCIVIFAVILLVIYLFPSPKHETKNCVQRCFESKEESQYRSVELREARKAELQSRPRRQKQESINDAFDVTDAV